MWNLGRVLGLPACPEEVFEQVKDKDVALSNVRRRDLKTLKEEYQEAPTNIQEYVLHGTGSGTSSVSKYQEAINKAMQELRGVYTGYVIRRTLTSKNFQGQAISGLPDYLEHDLYLTLSDWEQEYITKVTLDSMEDGVPITIYTIGKVRHALVT